MGLAGTGGHFSVWMGAFTPQTASLAFLLLYMRLFPALCVALWISVLPDMCFAQRATEQLLDMADSMVNRFQYEAAGEIAENLLVAALSDVGRAKALLVKAQVLERAGVMDTATAIALSALKIAEVTGLDEVAAGAHITLALIHEQIGGYDISNGHLDQAERLLFSSQLERQYGQYYVRRASLIRVSTTDEDAYVLAKAKMYELAQLAIKYARIYDQPRHVADAHLILGIIQDEDTKTMLHHKKAAIRIYKEAGDFVSAGYMYTGVASAYANMGKIDLAWSYYDSAVATYPPTKPLPPNFYGLEAFLFYKREQYDFAFAAMEQQQEVFAQDLIEQSRLEVSRLNAVHENEQKQALLQKQIHENAEQKKLLSRTVALLIAVLLILGLVFFGYRRKRSQNAKINEQRGELEQSLRNQKVLLAEVQHRVKNNLQVIIAMLDMQSEAPVHKSTEEIMKENQRRIESMAFLHDKVYLSDDLERVKLQPYLDQIAELLRSTYSDKDKEIKVTIDSEITFVPVDKAMPLGLMTVELLMNSFKHAFKEREHGSVKITTSKIDKSPYSSQFVYQDDGKGYDTASKSDGLGLEIINGLTGQLRGKIEIDGSNGFRATIQF